MPWRRRGALLPAAVGRRHSQRLGQQHLQAADQGAGSLCSILTAGVISSWIKTVRNPSLGTACVMRFYLIDICRWRRPRSRSARSPWCIGCPSRACDLPDAGIGVLHAGQPAVAMPMPVLRSDDAVLRCCVAVQRHTALCCSAVLVDMGLDWRHMSLQRHSLSFELSQVQHPQSRQSHQRRQLKRSGQNATAAISPPPASPERGRLPGLSTTSSALPPSAGRSHPPVAASL